MWKEGTNKPLEIWCLDFARMTHHLNSCLGLSVRENYRKYLAMPGALKREETGVEDED